MHYKSHLIFTVLLIIALLLPIAAYSQESTQEASVEAPLASEPAPVEPLEASELPSWAIELAYGVPLITALLGLGKYIPFLKDVPIARQKIILVLLLLLLHVYVKEAGNLELFTARVSDFGELASNGLKFVVGYFGSSMIYTEASKMGMPILGATKLISVPSKEQ